MEWSNKPPSKRDTNTMLITTKDYKNTGEKEEKKKHTEE